MIRKCGACPKPIEIDKEHTSNIVYYKNKYYHSSCFCDIATKRSQSKIKSASEWKEALDNLWELEAETEKMLKSSIAKDELNEWLLSHYDIAVVPARLWQIVADLERGAYKGKRCRPISMEMLVSVWKWGQRKLDEIARSNKANHKGPQNDETRLVYDLAILVGKVPSYLSYKEKQKAVEIERQRELKENIKIDYGKMANSTKKNDNNLQDISSLVDDLF